MLDGVFVGGVDWGCLLGVLGACGVGGSISLYSRASDAPANSHHSDITTLYVPEHVL